MKTPNENVSAMVAQQQQQVSSPAGSKIPKMDFPSPAGNIHPKRKLSKDEFRAAKQQKVEGIDRLSIDCVPRFRIGGMKCPNGHSSINLLGDLRRLQNGGEKSVEKFKETYLRYGYPEAQAHQYALYMTTEEDYKLSEFATKLVDDASYTICEASAKCLRDTVYYYAIQGYPEQQAFDYAVWCLHKNNDFDFSTMLVHHFESHFVVIFWFDGIF